MDGVRRATLWLGVPLGLLLTAWLAYSLGLKQGQTQPQGTSSPTPSVNLQEMELVEARPYVWQPRVLATGNLTADPNLQSRVGAPAAGRITRVLVNQGDRVQRGQLMAVLESPEIIKAAADYHHAEVRLHLAERTLAQRRQLARLGDTSRRPVEEARNEYAAEQADVEICQANLTLVSKKWKRTRDLYTHGIVSLRQVEEDDAALAEARSRLDKAQMLLRVASQHRSREERVAASGSLVLPKILEAETEAALAREEVDHAGQILHNFGLSGEEAAVPLRAPLNGVVVQRSVSLGQWVSAEQELFQVLDPAHLWLVLNLYEKDFARVRLGMAVKLPDLGLQGRVSYLPPLLEQGSRTLPVRVEVVNSGNLRVGMFTRAEIELARAHPGVAVAAVAIQGIEGEKGFVYLPDGKGGFEARKVVLGLEDKSAGLREIVSGLKAGEKVLGEGSYLLHQEPAPP